TVGQANGKREGSDRKQEKNFEFHWNKVFSVKKVKVKTCAFRSATGQKWACPPLATNNILRTCFPAPTGGLPGF
ncbi:MAG TPA: hypothetical protein PKL15_15180, partial [Saprospiraceae bacterium]|nr:hypothetical protein [Saprospiraceae bacterium]